MNSKITKADEPRIKRWLNCTIAHVDADSNVWVEGPMSGHRLCADKLKEFVAWRAAQKPGAPIKMASGRRRNVYLDDASWAEALRRGNGNASEGIRLAIAGTSGIPQ